MTSSLRTPSQSQLTALHISRFQPRKKEITMINTKRIAQLAKKWQRMAALGRKRLTAATKEVDK
jgi:hypothetical protein